MENKTKIIRKRVLEILIGLVILALAGYNFWIYSQKEQTKNGALQVVLAEEAKNLNPFTYDPAARTRLINIYEGLVGFNEDMSIVPMLTKSWGNIDDLTWEFKLRSEVQFHNGSQLQAQDVQRSIIFAKENDISEIKSLLSSIQAVEIEDSSTLIIKTYEPDPLLLNKLVAVFILPADYLDNPQMLENPVGTGPYKLEKWQKGEKMQLAAFADYWNESRRPFWAKAEIVVKSDKFERQRDFLEGKIDLLAAVPQSVVALAKDKKEFQMLTRSKLETKFLVFGFQTKSPFRDKRLRQAVSLGLNRDQIAQMGGGFTATASQFVGVNVYGFNPDIEQPKQNIEEAKQLLSELSGRTNVTLDIENNLQTLAQSIQYQLEQIGVRVSINSLDSTALLEKIEKGESYFYFMGWNSEIGDASDFFQYCVHSPVKKGDRQYGSLNGSQYRNQEVDRLIEQSFATLDRTARRDILEQINKIITVDDIIGVPLMEEQNVYLAKTNRQFTPRQDGYLYLADVK